MITTTDTSQLDAVARLQSLDGVVAKLRSGAMVADLACGHGLSTIHMAQAFPRSAFSGYDTDADAIATARALARQAVEGSPSGRNVRFEVAAAAAIPAYAYDLVTSFDALPDAAVAHRVRRAIAEDGTWMIVGPADDDLPAILEDAGFSNVRVVSETPFDVVLEARP